jgi:hypothetical protein
MEWYIIYRRETVDHMEMCLTPEAAIVAACLLNDCDCEVYGIGIGPVVDAIGPGEIAQFYGHCHVPEARSEGPPIT